jgi:predicted 2-oxoglutarate/Fe(II)-dependent dioxygenase YbiX
MLSESEDYEGGDLEIDIHKTMNPSKIPLDKGDIVFFDSTATHRVTPVTSGTRKVLAFWARGKCQE